MSVLAKKASEVMGFMLKAEGEKDEDKKDEAGKRSDKVRYRSNLYHF